MHPSTEFLCPHAKLVDEVADWLCGREPSEGRVRRAGRVRADPAGAASLAHVLVVVPTAQSGRNLRFALARRFQGRGLVPPRVVLPMALAMGADDTLPTASRVQLGAAYLKFMETGPEGGPAARWPHLFLPESLADSDSLLSFLDQLEDLWRLLGAGGLLMRDVPGDAAAAKVLADAQGDEAVRWGELADFETAFFGFLHEFGLRHEAERLHAARTEPPDLPAEIEEIVLPALADPVPLLPALLLRQRTPRTITVLVHADEADRPKFDEWGRPRVECWTGAARPVLSLRDSDIVCASTDGRLANRIAADFPEATADADIPSLGLCDDSLYNDLSAAFLGRGFELHNPEKYRLSASSLGRIADCLLSIHAAGGAAYPWNDFAALLREDDVLDHLDRTLSADSGTGEPSGTGVAEGGGEGAKPIPPARSSILKGLDVFRNAFFPSVLSPDGSFDWNRVDERDRGCVALFWEAAKTLREWVETARHESAGAAGFLREAFRTLYEGRMVGSGPADREFVAAIGALRDVLSPFSDDGLCVLGLSASAATALLRKSLADATYSLEPDSSDILTTEGWLELAWSPNDRVALAGFNEGAVPDSVSGHVFLPDALRAALGLPSNDQRLARDTFLLQSILDARAPGNVRAYFARTGDAGDIHRPSRLLFLVSDNHVAARAKALFGGLPPDDPRPPRSVADGWRPRLPLDVPMPRADDAATPEGRLTASAIDTWLSCPLAYLLKCHLGMEREEEKDELGANDFGTLVHAALEAYAREQLARGAAGEAQLSGEEEIRAALRRILSGLRAGFGRAPSLKLRLQLDAAEARLGNFASIQARWAREGWRIAEEPELEFLERPFTGEGDADVWIRGKIDRIDYKEGVGYRLIDYKTWDDRARARGHVLSGGAEEDDHAASLGLPRVFLPADLKNDGTPRKNACRRRFLSVQLPLYARCLEARAPGTFGGQVADWCYLVLGRNPDHTGVFGSRFEGKSPFGEVCLADPGFAQGALDTARIAIRAIRAGLFWPPGPGNALRYGLQDVFLNSPQRDLEGSDWLAEQTKRLAAFTGRGYRR